MEHVWGTTTKQTKYTKMSVFFRAFRVFRGCGFNRSVEVIRVARDFCRARQPCPFHARLNPQGTRPRAPGRASSLQTEVPLSNPRVCGLTEVDVSHRFSFVELESARSSIPDRLATAPNRGTLP